MDLLNKIGRELQRRYTFKEIDHFLRAMRLPDLSDTDESSSKWIYSKDRLVSVSDSNLLKTARALDIEPPSPSTAIYERPKFWDDNDRFRLFLSHVSTNKRRVHRLKEELEAYGVAAFVAHDDVKPTQLWANEIVKALGTMEAFVAVLSHGFKESAWCNQEAGYAIAKDIPRLSFKMGAEDPPGFISAEQALTWREGDKADDVAEEIIRVFWTDERNRSRILESFDAMKRVKPRPMDVMTELADRGHLRA